MAGCCDWPSQWLLVSTMHHDVVHPRMGGRHIDITTPVVCSLSSSPHFGPAFISLPLLSKAWPCPLQH